jgi:hypothetical protein
MANKECDTFQPYLEQGKAVYSIECTEEDELDEDNFKKSVRC